MHGSVSGDRRKALAEGRSRTRGSQGGAEISRAGDTALAKAGALKHQACLKAQIRWEDGHVSSGLRGFA
jgi:hypothetical protein